MVSQVVNSRLAAEILRTRKERRTTGNVGKCRRKSMKLRRICVTLRWGENHVSDVAETLECLIGFIESRIGFRKFVDTFFHNGKFPVIFGIDSGLLGEEHVHGSLQQPVVWIRWIQVTLELHAD